jgi:hypothetical protein
MLVKANVLCVNAGKAKKGENKTDFFHSEMHLLKSDERCSPHPQSGAAFLHEMRINI